MKKLITFIFIFCAFTAFAENAKEEVLNVRGELGLFLNENTKYLKKDFQIVEKDLTGSEESLKSLKKIAESFKLRSASPEVNPTLLKQGKEKIPECDYTKEDLEWKDNSWFCRKAEYVQDCEPTDDEKTINSGEDIVCVLKGSYKFVDAGWGLCNPATGFQKSKYKCMYIDSKGLAKYEVPDSKCGTKPEEKEYNCWGYWKAKPWKSCDNIAIKTCKTNHCVKVGRDSYCESFSYSCINPADLHQEREVTCSSKYCNNEAKPDSKKVCEINYSSWDSKKFKLSKTLTIVNYSASGWGYNNSHCLNGRGNLFTRNVYCTGRICNPSNIPNHLKFVITRYAQCHKH